MRYALCALIAIFSLQASANCEATRFDVEGAEIAAKFADKVLRCTEGRGLQLAEIGVRDTGNCNAILELHLHGPLVQVQTRFSPALYLDERAPIKIDRVYEAEGFFHLVGEFNNRPIVCMPSLNKWDASHHSELSIDAGRRLRSFIDGNQAVQTTRQTRSSR